MLADGVETGTQEEDGFLSINVIQALKRVVDGVVKGGLSICRDAHTA